MNYLLGLLLILVGCGAEEVSSPLGETSSYSPGDSVVLSGDYYANQWRNFSLSGSSVLGSLPPATGSYSYSLVNAPSWLSINSTSGTIFGNPDDYGVDQSVVIIATDSANSSNTHTRSFSIAVNGDPLREFQWHLNNTGQKAFSLSSATIGVDINAKEALSLATGRGVKIAISDSGGEINHDDLYTNILMSQNKNYTLDAPYLGDPTPTTAHGTAVAGLIAAIGWNNIGVTGVAPESDIAIFQFLNSPQTSSILIDQASGNFDIFNYSYGDVIFYDIKSDSDYLDQLEYQSNNGRAGLGSLFVKSSGNEFLEVDGGTCVSHNANFPLENESPHMIVVGAVDSDGVKAVYSNAGSNLWVVAPGGLDGESFPAMLTTDLPTCFRGYSQALPFVQLINNFEYEYDVNDDNEPWDLYNSSCLFTSSMNGTSSASPVVSGVIALMLDANPSLSARDVKHILATSSTQVDPTFSEALNGFGSKHPSLQYGSCTNLNLAGHTYEQGWITNGASVKFSNFYGFGLVDAKAAVDMALNFSLDPMSALPLPRVFELNNNFNDTIYRSIVNTVIPDNSSVGVSDSLNVTTSDIDFVESVQVRVLADHSQIGQLGIELTSPSGTKSILMNINNSFLLGSDTDLDIVLTSHAFYGEDPNGNWQIKLIDGDAGSTGTFSSWRINMLGHN